MTTTFKNNGVAIPDATGGMAWSRVLGEEGATDATATTVLFPVVPLGQVPTLYKTTGLMTLAETRGGILASTSSGSTIYSPQTYSMLAYTRTPGTTLELMYLVQRQGTGSLFVTPSQYRGEVASQAAMIGLSLSVVGDWCQRSDDSHNVYQLTTGVYSSAGNWTKQSAANRPNIFFGAQANNAALIGLSNAIVGDWCTKTDAAGATYQLQTAPYSTIGNWVQRTDVDKPTTPQVKIHWNNLDPQYLAAFHPPVMLTTCGIGNDEWVAS